jgi:predicted phosphodiesterase
VVLPVPQAEAQRRLHALATHRSMAQAARSIGLKPSTLREWAGAHATDAPRPDYAPPEVDTKGTETGQQFIIRPNYRISQDRVDGQGKIRVVAIGDAHDAPSIPDKSRFRRIGQYIAATKPDMVIQIGDLASVDSLSRHDRNETHIGRSKPTFPEDLESLKAALTAFEEGLDGYDVNCHQTEGNHEKRAWSWMNNNPEVAGMVDTSIHTVMQDHGWTVSPYGALHFVGGVAWTHCPLNTMGKEYGGMYAENQISRDSLHSVVYGHSHKPLHKSYPKLGHRRLQVINLGCFLPHGHIEKYAQHSLTGWGFGFYDITIERGEIQLADWRPMTWLEENYP